MLCEGAITRWTDKHHRSTAFYQLEGCYDVDECTSLPCRNGGAYAWYGIVQFYYDLRSTLLSMPISIITTRNIYLCHSDYHDIVITSSGRCVESSDVGTLRVSAAAYQCVCAAGWTGVCSEG